MKKIILILGGIIFVIWGGLYILQNNSLHLGLDDLVGYCVILLLGIVSLVIGFCIKHK